MRNIYQQTIKTLQTILRIHRKIFEPYTPPLPNHYLLSHIVDLLGLGRRKTAVNWTCGITLAFLWKTKISNPLIPAVVPYVFVYSSAGTTFQCVLSKSSRFLATLLSVIHIKKLSHSFSAPSFPNPQCQILNPNRSNLSP